MNALGYSLSFTAGGLLQPESIRLAQLYLELGDWAAVRERVLAHNLLQARTLASARRLCQEILARLKTLSDAELDLLAQGHAEEQRQILWLSLCRRYPLIAEFALEVLGEGYRRLQPQLQASDIDAFFNRKAEWHGELERLKPSTRKKLRQMLLKLLKDSSLLSADLRILPAIPSRRLQTIVRAENRPSLLFFPMDRPQR